MAAAHTEIDAKKISGEEVEIAIPFDSHTVAADGSRRPSVPGIRGKVRLRISAWE